MYTVWIGERIKVYESYALVRRSPKKWFYMGWINHFM